MTSFRLPGGLLTPELDPIKGRGVAVRYPSRDGWSIPAYLYAPPGPAQDLPAVILCHGGPEACIRSPDNPEALFLASRGILVLEPNFRGSTGFGKKFQSAGYGQWGRTMQDDLSDGAAWLVAQGYADPKRLGIMGASYGGYAALAGAALTPELYCCAVSMAGPSNLLSYLASPQLRDDSAYFKLLIGDPVEQAEALAAVSPLQLADRIKIPILLAHGSKDVRVPRRESDQMAQALRSRGQFVPYLVWDDEGHGWQREEHRLEFYRAVENFFGLHLGSRVEAPSPIPLSPSRRPTDAAR